MTCGDVTSYHEDFLLAKARVLHEVGIDSHPSGTQ